MDLSGKVAVITGGASGIGAAMAHAFGKQGMKIVLADVDAAGLEKVTGELQAQGIAALGHVTDVRQTDSMRALADAACARFGAVHLLCNNAGVCPLGEMMAAPLEEWRFVMDVNFWGVVNGVREFVPRMLAKGEGGHVLNTASMAGLVGMQLFGVYGASKFAVVGLSEGLSRELKPQGIGVSVLCPMVVDTGLLASTARLNPTASDAVVTLDKDQLQQVAGTVRTPEQVAARAVAGVQRGDFYILTHTEQAELLRKRSQRLESAFVKD